MFLFLAYSLIDFHFSILKASSEPTSGRLLYLSLSSISRITPLIFNCAK